MSCESPFTLSVGLTTTLVEWTSTVNYTGSTTVPPYTFSTQLTFPDFYSCTLGLNCKCCCYKSWLGFVEFCVDVPCCKTQDLTWGYSQQLWPKLTFAASCSTVWSFTSSLSSKFSLSSMNKEAEESPDEPVTTVFCNTIALEDTVVSLIINGNAISYTAPSSVEVGTETNTSTGETEFVIQISFPSEYCISGSTEGVSYDISPYWLICSEPTPPVGWLNLDIPISLSLDAGSYNVALWGWNYDVNVGTYSTTATIACPLISVED